MKQISLPTKSKAGSTEAVHFADGMLVTAEDLNAATQYPLQLLQVLVRSYFGCGVVCGLGLGYDPAVSKEEGCGDANGTPASATGATGYRSFVVQVARGVALDCHGFPLELCGPLKIDLSPDPCACGDPPTELCLAIRHVASTSAPKSTCACSCSSCAGEQGSDPQQQCTRVRDHVEIRAFPPDGLPENLCARPQDDPAAGRCADDSGATPTTTGSRADGRQSICDCLTDCPDCSCCGEAWVLLGYVTLDKDGITDISTDRRRYVKPIECPCARPEPVPTAKPEEPAELRSLRAQLGQHQEAMVRYETEINALRATQDEFRKAMANMGQNPPPPPDPAQPGTRPKK